jgi:hypothetical protein
MYIGDHFYKNILLDLFVQEERKGPETLVDLNTPQEENNKFEVRPWNSNLVLFSNFHL